MANSIQLAWEATNAKLSPGLCKVCAHLCRGKVCAYLLAAVLVLAGPGGSPLRGRDSTGGRSFCQSLVHPSLKTCSAVPARMF